MNMRVFFAIVGGCIFGGAIVYALATEALWYMAGVPLGGAMAWLIYAWRDIKREAPSVWQTISSWRPDIERWKARGVYMLSTMLLATAAAMNFPIFILLVAGPAVIYQEWFHTLMIFVFIATFVLSIHDSLDTYRDRRKRRVSSRGILFVAKKKRQLIFALSPIGVSIMLFELAVYSPTLALTVGKFLVRLFVRVHSHEALNCFIYAAVGVLIGALLTRSLWVMGISAVTGILLAIIFLRLARLLRLQWPSLA